VSYAKFRDRRKNPGNVVKVAQKLRENAKVATSRAKLEKLRFARIRAKVACTTFRRARQQLPTCI